jgi:hypothetical protein
LGRFFFTDALGDWVRYSTNASLGVSALATLAYLDTNELVGLPILSLAIDATVSCLPATRATRLALLAAYTFKQL